MTENPTPTPKSIPKKLDTMVQQFVKLRDAIKAVEATNVEKLQPSKDYLEQLNAAILAKLGELGLDNAKTQYGTAYRITQKSATIADGEVFRKFVIDSGDFEMVDWRANANAVSDYVAENNGELPPGVNFSLFTKAGVRRS